jgi:hypothetical protein
VKTFILCRPRSNTFTVKMTHHFSIAHSILWHTVRHQPIHHQQKVDFFLFIFGRFCCFLLKYHPRGRFLSI